MNVFALSTMIKETCLFLVFVLVSAISFKLEFYVLWILGGTVAGVFFNRGVKIGVSYMTPFWRSTTAWSERGVLYHYKGRRIHIIERNKRLYFYKDQIKDLLLVNEFKDSCIDVENILHQHRKTTSHDVHRFVLWADRTIVFPHQQKLKSS
jgi:hypothetical protein